MQKKSQPSEPALLLIGIGPGDSRQMTLAARDALRSAGVVIGYELYVEMVQPLLSTTQEVIASPIGDEIDRAERAVELAASGTRVALISSGDAGIYAMAGPLFEVLRERGRQGRDEPRLVVYPGISALQAAAARLGAPIAHDFCAISLSDLLTPWEIIERRVEAAAYGDFVVAFYNPRSRQRDWQLDRALAILREHRPAETPVALVRNVTRTGESVHVTTLAAVEPAQTDMLTLVLVGNSQTYRLGDWMATPRGYSGIGRR